MNPTLTPRLVVRRPDDAIEFYRRAFGARLEERYVDDAGHVVHALLSIDGVKFGLTEERDGWQGSPESLGGSAVILNLVVADVDAVAGRLQDAGAEVVFPVANQFYGQRAGRFRDPFGHLWIVTTIIEELTPKEIQKRASGGR